MKLNSLLFSTVVMSGLVCSCQDVEQDIVLNGSEVVFVASTEETKMTISEDYRTLYWSAADAISVLDGTSNVFYETSDEGAKVRFTSNDGISDDAEDIYAVYPYSEAAHRIGDGVQVVMPAQQTVSVPGFDPKSSLAVAYTSSISKETLLDFKNLCSYFKFTVPSEDEVVEVILRGGEKEYLAGKVNVTFDKGIPSCTVIDGISEITFRSETPMNGVYIVPLLPCVLQEGLSVTLKCRDGRSAVHKVIAKDESGLESAVIFVRGKVNKATLGFDQPKWRSAPVAEVVDAAASTVTFRWSENEFSSPETDFAGRYHIALYSDENCSNLVHGMDFDISSWTNVKYPAFCLTSLTPETDYWFVVTDKDTEASCTPLKVTTAADDFMQVGQNAAEGTVILKENFSELYHGGDPVNVAWGYGEEGFIAPKDLINWNSVDMTSMRLASWKEKTEGANYAGPGYIRVGDSSSQKNAILTPELASLNACATVEVSFKAAPYSSDYGVEGNSRLGECYAEVWVVNGDKQVSAGVVELNDTPTQWTTCTINAVNVLPDSRIAIGGAFGEKTQASSGKQYCRIYLDDVQVKLLRYEEVVAVIPPEVEIKKTFWSDSFIEWTCGGSPNGYRVYLGDKMIAELAADVTGYHITGLDAGQTYDVKVSALYNASDEGYSRPVSLTTGAISQITRNLSPTSLSISFDPCGEITDNVNAAYYIQLSKNADMSDLVYDQYIVDGRHVYNGHPFVACPVSGKDRAETRIALGNLEPNTTYYFRIRSDLESAMTFSGTHSSGTKQFKLTSTNEHNSSFSKPIAFTTSSVREKASDEVLYESFDGFSRLADFVNYAVGTEQKNVSDIDGNIYWTFASLRYSIASTQIAHYKWSTNDSDKIFPEINLSTNSEVAAFKSANAYKVNETSPEIVGWYVSNNTWGYQGYLGMGSADKFGYVVTPALESELLSLESKACSLAFRAIAAQDYDVTVQVSVYDAVSGTWSKAGEVKINNAGPVNSFDYRWYDYKVEGVSLKKGDFVALSTTAASGLVFIDDISIKIK